MRFEELPQKMQETITWICQEYQVDKQRVLEDYGKCFNDPKIAQMLPNEGDKAARHQWSIGLLRSNYENRPIMREKDVVFFGSSGTSSFDQAQRRLYVYDLRTKEKSCITLKGNIVFNPNLVGLVQFQKYEGIQLAPTKEGWLTLDERSLPLPEYVPFEAKGTQVTPSMFMNALKVRKVKMAEFGDPNKQSRKTADGVTIYSDIICIENVFITKSSVSEREVNGHKFKSGFMQFADHTTTGIILDDGTEIKPYVNTYMQEEDCYPVNSVGDIYGTLRQVTPRDKSKPKKLAFEFCCFNAKMKYE